MERHRRALSRGTVPVTEVFTYGSLVVPEVWALVAGRMHASEPAVLHGFRRRQVRGAPYPGIVPAESERTEGVLWRDVGAEVVERLDDFEGDLYERRAVEVRTEGGPATAEVYIVIPAKAHLLAPEPWDEARFRARDLASYLEGCRRFAQSWAGRD